MRRRIQRRLLPIEVLETRALLSGLSLVDVDVDHFDDNGYSEYDLVGDYHLDDFGNEYHVLPSPTGTVGGTGAASRGSSLPGAAASLSETFFLHSNPGAAHTIFLDFDGETTSGTIWNDAFNGGANIITPAYSFAGDATFDDSELSRIQSIWQRVAEDFIPFDVDVTTEQPSADGLVKSGSGDPAWGVRVVVGGNGSWYGGAGGVAYVGSFNWNSDTPVFVFEDNLGNGNEKYTAEAITHEAGHALGLSHDGRTSPSEDYYQGHGSGATGWAPIMGVGYYKELTQWSRGEYLYANNTQDDLAIITGNNGFGYRADDHGDTLSSASTLAVSSNLVSGQGIIERNTDTDWFTFLTDAGSVSLEFTPFERGPNLDIAASLFDATGAMITSSNPIGSLSASIAASLAAGQYYVQVTGAGQGDPLGTGYSDYGSLGSYTFTGSVVESNIDTLSITATDADRAEGDLSSTGFTFTVTRSGNTSASTQVAWSASGGNGTPASSSDFLGGQYPGGILSFAPGETSKLVTVDVEGDLNFESDESFNVTLSGATNGALITTATAGGMIRNDDAAPTPAGITVTPTSGLTTSESGGTAAFNVVLDKAPTANVTIGLVSTDTTEGTVNQSSLVFTPSNWNVPQTVTIAGVDDSVRDRNVAYTIQVGAAQSNDASYDGLNPDDVQVTNQDNEKGGGSNKGGKGGKGKKGVKAAAVLDFNVPPQIVVGGVHQTSNRANTSWTTADRPDASEQTVDRSRNDRGPHAALDTLFALLGSAARHSTPSDSQVRDDATNEDDHNSDSPLDPVGPNLADATLTVDRR